MATVGVGKIVRGTNVTDLAPNAASSGGDKFTPGGDVWLHLVNADTVATRQVTVDAPGNVGGLAITDLVITVPISGSVTQGPFPVHLFAGDDGLVSMTYDNEADLTFGAWKLGQ